MATANEKRRKAQLGKRNSNYKRGWSVNSDGYITRMSGKRGGNGRKLEHRIITRAPRGTKVHHKNNKTKGLAARRDNRRSNLQVTRRHSGTGGK